MSIFDWKVEIPVNKSGYHLFLKIHALGVPFETQLIFFCAMLLISVVNQKILEMLSIAENALKMSWRTLFLKYCCRGVPGGLAVGMRLKCSCFCC